MLSPSTSDARSAPAGPPDPTDVRSCREAVELARVAFAVVAEFAFVELPEGFDRFLWREFVTEFDFRHARRPAIREPVPSVTWTLPPCGTFGVAGDPTSTPVLEHPPGR
jgi:hypothetical protein